MLNRHHVADGLNFMRQKCWLPSHGRGRIDVKAKERSPRRQRAQDRHCVSERPHTVLLAFFFVFHLHVGMHRADTRGNEGENNPAALVGEGKLIDDIPRSNRGPLFNFIRPERSINSRAGPDSRPASVSRSLMHIEVSAKCRGTSVSNFVMKSERATEAAEGEKWNSGWW
ncbi:hypothetical protein KM043_010259 [Ampulex compressa]|nr:hypothetical protein KM043_010259 [Ampulex compressa]